MCYTRMCQVNDFSAASSFMAPSPFALRSTRTRRTCIKHVFEAGRCNKTKPHGNFARVIWTRDGGSARLEIISISFVFVKNIVSTIQSDKL